MRSHVLALSTAAVCALAVSSCTSGGSSGEPTVEPATSTSAYDPSSPTAALSTDWPTYHHDNQRTGHTTTLRTVLAPLHRVWNVKLDGAVYASPIVVRGMTIVATENNSLYRIRGNKVMWRHHIGTPVPRSALPCGNIDPLGITGTPAYDGVTNTVVAVAELGNPVRHIAVGVDPTSGAQKWSRVVDVPSSVTGVTPTAMQQRGALIVSGRRVYIPYGGLAGDCGSYRGSVVGVDLGAPTTAALWNFTVPSSRRAGIWAPPGPVENPGGGLLVAVGNGAAGAENRNGPYDYSDSILKIAFQRIIDHFSPSSWRSDNAGDLDLGSQGPTIVGNWVFAAGKSGTAYVLNRNRLGGIGGQVSQQSVCTSFGGTAVNGSVVYVPCTDGLRAVRINSNGTMSLLWHAASNVTGSPVLGGGVLWSLDPNGGMLHLLDPNTGKDKFSPVSVGTASRFATPALWFNAVLVGTTNGIVAYNWS